jgi:hypothetical protein
VGWKNCTLLQILVYALAGAICKCVQCALAFLTVPKGRSGSAKAKCLNLVNLSIILFISLFNILIFRNPFLFSSLAGPGSLRPLRTVRASFPAHGSGTFKAVPVRGDPAVITTFVVVDNKSSHLSAFFG